MGGGMSTQARSRLGIDRLWGGAVRAKLFRNGRSQAVRLPAEFRFEGTEVEVHRDPESGAVVLTPVRPSTSALLDQRDALLQDPGFQAELAVFFEGLRDTCPAEPVEFP